MSTKDAIAQNIMEHEALFSITKLLDQFKDGLRKMNALRLVQNFPELCVGLFTFSGTITPDEVLDALYVDETETLVQPSDNVTLAFLHRYVRSCSDGGVL